MIVKHTYQSGSKEQRQARLEAIHRRCLLLLRREG